MADEDQDTQTLPRVGDFQPRDREELDLARRAVQFRRAGDNDAYERAVAAIVARRRGSRGRAALLGAGNGIFGLGDYAAPALNFVRSRFNADPSDDSNFLQDARRQSLIRGAMRERYPVSNAIGEVGGVVVTLPAASAASARILPNAGRLQRAVVTGGAFGAQQGAANNLAEEGATEGAIESAVEGAVEGGVTGAVTGGVVDTAARVLAPFLRSVGDRMASDNGLRALSRHMSVSFADLQTAAQRFSAQFGRNPTLAEVAGIADPALAREAGQIVGSRRAASQVASEGAEALRGRRQTEVAEAVMPGSSTQSNITGQITDAGMARLQGAALNVGSQGPLYDFLTRPNVARLIRSMPPEQRARLGEAIENGGRITVRDLDNLRQAANNASDSGAAYAYNQISETATQFADRATRGQFSQVIRRDHRANATREELANSALASPRGAEQTAERLSGSAQLQRDLVADVGPAEAARLQEVGDVASRAARGVDEVSPSRIRTAADEQAQGIQDAARIAFLHKTGGAGIASFVSQQLTRLGVGPRGAAELARDLTDPQRFPDAMNRLQALIGRGGTQTLVDRVARQFAVRMGAGSATAEPGIQPSAGGGREEAASSPTVMVERVLPNGERVQMSEEDAAIFDGRAESGQNPGANSAAPRSEQELIDALYAADEAGDEEAARALAAAIRQMRSGQ